MSLRRRGKRKLKEMRTIADRVAAAGRDGPVAAVEAASGGLVADGLVVAVDGDLLVGVIPGEVEVVTAQARCSTTPFSWRPMKS